MALSRVRHELPETLHSPLPAPPSAQPLVELHIFEGAQGVVDALRAHDCGEDQCGSSTVDAGCSAAPACTGLHAGVPRRRCMLLPGG